MPACFHAHVLDQTEISLQVFLCMILTGKKNIFHSGLKSEFFMQIWHHRQLHRSEFYSFVKYETIKIYLCYKICYLRDRLRIFSFRRKVMFLCQDIQVFKFLAIPRFSKSVTSWKILVHKTGWIFEYIFWTTTHYLTDW